MKTTIKKSILFITVLTIVFNNCFSMDSYGQQEGPGGYGPGIAQMPLGSEIVTPIYNNSHRQSHNPYSQPSTQTVTSQHQTESNTTQKFSNSSGFSKDIMSSTYDNSSFFCSAFGNNFSNKFYRMTKNSTLLSIRACNTYQSTYLENNKNSSIICLELFNNYKDGKILNNNNSTSFTLCLGNTVTWKNNTAINLGNNTNSFHFDRNISKEVLAALAITGIVLKTGAIPAILATNGIVAPSLLIVPVAIGGVLFFPVFVAIGGTLVVVGFTIFTGLVGAGISVGSALLPIVIPLWIVKKIINGLT